MHILLGPAIFAQDKINLHKNKYIFPKIIAYDPSIYIMNHPAFIVCNCGKAWSVLKVKRQKKCMSLKFIRL